SESESESESGTEESNLEMINDRYAWNTVCEGLKIIVCTETGYINGGKLCQTVCKLSGAKKRMRNWFLIGNVKELLDEISSLVKIDVDDLTFVISGGRLPEITGTYVHPLLITHIVYWLSPR